VSQCYTSLSLSLSPPLPLFSIRLANHLFRPWIDARTIYIPSRIPSRRGYSDERFSPRGKDWEVWEVVVPELSKKKTPESYFLFACTARRLHFYQMKITACRNVRWPNKKRLSIINDFPTSISSNSGFACCFSVGEERDWKSNFESALYYYISDMIK